MCDKSEVSGETSVFHKHLTYTSESFNASSIIKTQSIGAVYLFSQCLADVCSTIRPVITFSTYTEKRCQLK